MAVKRKGEVKIAFEDGNTNLYTWKTEINKEDQETCWRLESRDAEVSMNYSAKDIRRVLCFPIHPGGVECIQLTDTQFDAVRAFFQWYNEMNTNDSIHDVDIKLTSIWNGDKFKEKISEVL